jgi:hypothetical protein
MQISFDRKASRARGGFGRASKPASIDKNAVEQGI